MGNTVVCGSDGLKPVGSEEVTDDLTRLCQLLTPRLDGEVRLADGDDGLGRVGVLNDQITRVAGHHHGLDRTLSALADEDHIGDLTEMIGDRHSTVETGRASPFDNRLEVAVIGSRFRWFAESARMG
jgi:hypothetical protein